MNGDNMTGITIHSHDTGTEPSGQTWTTDEMTRDFEVEGFQAPYVVVRRKSDGVLGSLEFKHGPPRIYFGFVEA